MSDRGVSMKVMFFPNGNTIVFQDGQQVPDLQREGWFMLYVQMLASIGIDVEQIDFTMPDARRANIISQPDGSFNWMIEDV